VNVFPQIPNLQSASPEWEKNKKRIPLTSLLCKPGITTNHPKPNSEGATVMSRGFSPGGGTFVTPASLSTRLKVPDSFNWHEKRGANFILGFSHQRPAPIPRPARSSVVGAISPRRFLRSVEVTARSEGSLTPRSTRRWWEKTRNDSWTAGPIVSDHRRRCVGWPVAKVG
jgi:hypothetical protein